MIEQRARALAQAQRELDQRLPNHITDGIDAKPTLLVRELSAASGWTDALLPSRLENGFRITDWLDEIPCYP